MGGEKKISVVIPVYNREKIVLRTLECISLQDTRDFNLIIVDNNSQDNSFAVITSWAERNKDINCLICTEKTPGASAARNSGLRHVVTDYVMFFDSDDVMDYNHISSVINEINSHPNVDVIGWEGLQEQSNGKFKLARFTVTHPMRNHLIFGTLSTFRYAVKTELIRKVGGWNEKLRAWDDYELGVRILLAKPVMVKRKSKPKVKSFYSTVSLTANTFSGNVSLWEDPLNEIENLLAERYPQMLPWIDYRRAVLAAFYAMEEDDEEAQRLLSKTISDRRTSEWLIKIIYYWHLKVKTGAWLIASLFLPKE